MKFSVIVAAYNEEKLLPKCLKSLSELDFDKNEFEIILVNNNSNDKTKDIALSFEGVKVIDEPKQGKVFALIRGCREAKGEILVFTDADCEVPQDWLKKFAEAYENEKVVCAGGPGDFEPRKPVSLAAEKIIKWGGYATRLAPCFNLSIRKKTYEALGGFDPKVNFDEDIFLVSKSKGAGKFQYLLKNPVKTSSRRYNNLKDSLVYGFKGLVNLVSLVLFKKPVYFDFGNVRD